jgi:CMP-2-keto-3-deoxyoctulosonic acid synthetase
VCSPTRDDRVSQGLSGHVCKLPPTPLDAAESIDMLRAIEPGYKGRMVISPRESFGVDTPDDLRTAEARLVGDPLGRAVFAGTRG